MAMSLRISWPEKGDRHKYRDTLEVLCELDGAAFEPVPFGTLTPNGLIRKDLSGGPHARSRASIPFHQQGV